VLVLLYPRAGEPHLVLERRPAELPLHAGQISLPGGGYRVGDGDDLGTARRELFEELGVTPQGYEPWGRLDPIYVPASNFAVTPYVAYAPRQPEFRPSPREVAEVLEVPLRVLVDPATLAEEVWELRGAPRRVSFFRHGEHKIWGATARVLGQISAILRDEGWDETILSPGSVIPWP
jgi:8-oxo-dGTP pyrophosphatase MutT (NUDIX family)